MKLISRQTGIELRIGAKVKTLRNEDGVLTYTEEPRHSGSTGRVGVELTNGKTHYWFPSVIDAQFVEDKVK